jgi:hypothetical protein
MVAPDRPRPAPRRRLLAVATSILVAAGLAALAPTADRAGAATVSVALSGNRLVDGSGRTIRLLGVNRSGAEFACVQGWGIWDGPVDAASVAAMASWKVNAVRVPLNEDCWLGINGVDPAYSGVNYRSAIGNYVALLHSYGLAVIVDLHWNAPGTALASGQQVMADADHAPAFWSSVATYFKADRGVLFDLYNEPHDITWQCWRDGCTTTDGWQTAGMQSLVNAVRGAGAKQVILLGGLGWASDLSQWLQWKPSDYRNQTAASLHMYDFGGCGGAACWGSRVSPVASSVPVVTGEVGSSDCAPGYVSDFANWADGAGVSYLGWTWNTWDCRGGPALITSYDGTPTGFGAGLRDHLVALASAGGTTTTTAVTTTSTTRQSAPTSTSTTTSTTVAAGSVPSAPQNFAVRSSPGATLLSWSPPATSGGSPVTSYRVYRGGWGAETLLTTVTGTSFADSGPAPYQWLFYRVAAVNAAGQGPYTQDVGGSHT